MFDIGGGGDGVQQVPDIFQITYLRRSIFLLKTILQYHQVCRLTFIAKFHQGLKYESELLLVKVLRSQKLRCRYNGVPVHDHGAYNSLFRFSRIGHNSF